MNAFAAALGALHADPNLGVDGEFRRPPADWKPARFIRAQPSEDLGTARARTFMLDILAAEISVTPVKGDRIRIAGVIRKVEEAEPDDLGLSWRLTLSDPVAS